MGTIELEYETTNLDDSTNRTLKVYAEFTGSEDDGACIDLLEVQDEDGNDVKMVDLNVHDQDKIESLVQGYADDAAHEDWYENQISMAENYYEGDR